MWIKLQFQKKKKKAKCKVNIWIWVLFENYWPHKLYIISSQTLLCNLIYVFVLMQDAGDNRLNFIYTPVLCIISEINYF